MNLVVGIIPDDNSLTAGCACGCPGFYDVRLNRVAVFFC